MADTGKWLDIPLNQSLEVYGYHGSGTATIGHLWQSSETTLATLARNQFMAGNGPVYKARLINLIYNKDPSGDFLQNIPPLYDETSQVQTRNSTCVLPRGIYYSKAIGKLIEGWDQKIFVAGTVTGTTFTDDNAGGPIGFADGFDGSGNSYCFVTSQTDAVTVDASGTLTTVSDGDYPDPAIPTPVFLDSYIFVAKGGTRSIYNSSPGDPTTWQASTFINTEDSAGKLVGLARHHRWLVALCEDHVEFFEDAGIPSPNSPLRRVADMTAQIGCVNRATICKNGNIVYFAGREQGTVRSRIYKIEDGKITAISNPAVDNMISSHIGSGYTQGYISSWGYDLTTSSTLLSTNYSTMYVTHLRTKPVVILVIKWGAAAYNASTTSYGMPSFLYDIETGTWSEIMVPHQTSSHYVYGGIPMPFGCVFEKSSSTPLAVFISPVKSGNSSYYLFDTSGIQLGYYDTDKSTFNGSAAGWYGLQTPMSDWGIPHKKFINGLYLGHQSVLAEPSAEPYAVTLYTANDIPGLATTTVRTADSVPVYNGGGGSLTLKNRIISYRGGAQDDFGVVLRLTNMSQVSAIYSFKLRMNVGTR